MQRGTKNHLSMRVPAWVEHLQERLEQRGGCRPRPARRAARRFHRLLGALEELAEPAAAWRALEGAGGGAKQRREVRRDLLRAATLAVDRGTPSDGGRPREEACVPRHVPPGGPAWQVLVRVARGAGGTTGWRTPSAGTLRALLLFVDHLLHDPPALWSPGTTATAEERWRFLRGLGARAWLERWRGVLLAAGRRPIGFALFKRQLRWLSLLHGAILHPEQAPRVAVPVPRRTAPGALRPFTARPPASGFGSSGPSGTEAEQDERRELLGLVHELRLRACRPPSPTAPERSAFSRAEVHAIVRAAASPLEQLVVVLLLTTGLRLGGLVRLRAAEGLDDILETVEKNGRPRTVRPTHACRWLLTRWYAAGGRPAGGYVFPSPMRAGAPLSTRRMHQVCARVFERAGVRGPVAHPHAFRHTVVHMLFMNGSSFVRGRAARPLAPPPEAIAKWIGHASPAVTSSVYGRLSEREVEASLQGVPFLAEDRARVAGEWRELARFLCAPYPFIPPPPETGTTTWTEQRKRALLGGPPPALGGGGGPADRSVQQGSILLRAKVAIPGSRGRLVDGPDARPESRVVAQGVAHGLVEDVEGIGGGVARAVGGGAAQATEVQAQEDRPLGGRDGGVRRGQEGGAQGGKARRGGGLPAGGQVEGVLREQGEHGPLLGAGGGGAAQDPAVQAGEETGDEGGGVVRGGGGVVGDGSQAEAADRVQEAAGGVAEGRVEQEAAVGEGEGAALGEALALDGVQEVAGAGAGPQVDGVVAAREREAGGGRVAVAALGALRRGLEGGEGRPPSVPDQAEEGAEAVGGPEGGEDAAAGGGIEAGPGVEGLRDGRRGSGAEVQGDVLRLEAGQGAALVGHPGAGAGGGRALEDLEEVEGGHGELDGAQAGAAEALGDGGDGVRDGGGAQGVQEVGGGGLPRGGGPSTRRAMRRRAGRRAWARWSDQRRRVSMAAARRRRSGPSSRRRASAADPPRPRRRVCTARSRWARDQSASTARSRRGWRSVHVPASRSGRAATGGGAPRWPGAFAGPHGRRRGRSGARGRRGCARRPAAARGPRGRRGASTWVWCACGCLGFEKGNGMTKWPTTMQLPRTGSLPRIPRIPRSCSTTWMPFSANCYRMLPRRTSGTWLIVSRW